MQQSKHQPPARHTVTFCQRMGKSSVRIAKTSLMPEYSKQVVLLERTVPWEDDIEEAQEQKRAKHLELLEACRASGWRACCEPIEVGCRGFPGQFLHGARRLLWHERVAGEESHRKHQRSSRIKNLPGGCGSRGTMYGIAHCLDTS